ncbi:hypothetical protein [Herbidospora daliensis]|uniref:hypothetical protein n=1 Tax=Herbidospora daliensis TaxID=295585 RepID=UPI000784B367|nr:hypothetical protein [Herbidospora daliensis]
MSYIEDRVSEVAKNVALTQAGTDMLCEETKEIRHRLSALRLESVGIRGGMTQVDARVTALQEDVSAVRGELARLQSGLSEIRDLLTTSARQHG